jgi:hypothetical protein
VIEMRPGDAREDANEWAGLKVYSLHTWEIEGIEPTGSPQAAVDNALAATRGSRSRR